MKRVLIALAALSVASCNCTSAITDTSMYLTVTFDTPVVDQLQISVPMAEDGGKLEPTDGGPLTSPQTVRLLLPDSLAGVTTTVHVDGLSAGTIVSSGETAMTVALHTEIDVTVALKAIVAPQTCGPTTCSGCCTADGGCETGTTPAACGSGGGVCNPCGGTCSDAGVCSDCNASNCTGCCSGTNCFPIDLGHCAAAAPDACKPCDVSKADTCAAGACKCGTSAACGDGQRCDPAQHKCVCDATTCPNGCCNAQNACVTIGDTTCGIAGAACKNCQTDITSNHCLPSGVCGCGTNAACSDGQSCVGGNCGCTMDSCHGGCCSGPLCLITGPDNCGVAGSTCHSCDDTVANSCGSNGCTCGVLPQACASGQRCNGDQCICDGTSCPDGCCDTNGACINKSNDATRCGTGGSSCGGCPGGQNCANGVCSGCNPGNCGTCCNGSTCASPTTKTACGSGGNACSACNGQRADGCDAGECVCGVGAACAVGQVCDAGSCTCDPTSCPTGCCNGNVCETFDAGQSAAECGTGGHVCGACTLPSSNGCTSGSCRCGSNAACGPGLRCNVDAGACVCDATSGCSGCCASANKCQLAGTTVRDECGTGGVTCTACNSAKADNCADGSCHCGDGGTCGAGLVCQGGACVCNTSSGCTGCCADTHTCVAGTQVATCGSGGAACVDCGADRNNNCSNNACHCGILGAAACPVGQSCGVLLGLTGCN